jgi:hypothetical protein
VSAVYLYAVTARRSAAPGDLRVLSADGISGVYEPAPDHEPLVTEDALWAHEAVVEALWEEGPVLPARFGTVLPSVERLRAELEERRAEFAEALAFVRDRVELGVRAAWPERRFESGAPESGRAYLARKLELQQAAADAAAYLHEPLARIAVADTVEIHHAPCLTLVGAYLVERADVVRFRNEAGRLAKTLEGVRLACTGPWPPYSFAERPSAS